MEDWPDAPVLSMPGWKWVYSTSKDADDLQQSNWELFHYATRLKLKGADHFSKTALDVAAMPSYMGLPELAYKELKWDIGVFFFELVSAYDCLLKEINVIYNLGLKVESAE